MTSISDRCKTAQEKATPGPWKYLIEDYEASSWESGVAAWIYSDHGEIFANGMGFEVGEKDQYGHNAVLVSLAPEAADEVVRLTDALEALAEWHDNEAELTEHPGGAITRMELCNTHRHAAARIRRILNAEGAHP